MSLVWGGAKSEDYQFVERDEIYVPDRCYAIWRPDLDGAGAVLREQLGYRPQSPQLIPNIQTGTDTLGDTTGLQGRLLTETLSSSSDYAHTGSKSFKIVTLATVSSGCRPVYSSPYVLPVAVGQTWKTDFWLLAPSGQTIRCALQGMHATFGGTEYSDTDVVGTGDWQYVTVRKTLSNVATVWLMNVWHTVDALITTFYLDDISLVRTDLSDANGAISGALWRQGPTGSVLRFDSVGDDFVKVTGDMIGTGAVSIEALVYLNGWGGGDIGRILDNGTCRLYIGNATQRKVNFVRSGASAATNLTELALGNWYHILMTCTLTGLTIIYVNGVSDRPAGLTYGAPAVGRDTYIGNRAEADRGFDGDIALLRLYDKALTAGEVYEAYRDVAPLAGLG